MEKPKNIIFFSNGAIGDLLMTTLFFENVSAHYGENLSFTIAVPRNRSLLAGFLEAYPDISLVELNRRSFFQTAQFLFKKIFARNTVITHHTFGTLPFQVKLTAKLLTLLPGSRLIGFRDKAHKREWMYDTLLDFDANATYIQNLEHLLHALNIEMSISTPQFRYTEQEHVLEKYALQSRSYIVLHPFAATRGRSLPSERWEAIIRNIEKQYPDVTILITGAGKDAEAANDIADASNKAKAALNCTPSELATLIDNALLYVGVDTGITHLAGFLHAPSVVIGHRSNPAWLPYYNENAEILFENENCTCPGDKNTNCHIEKGDVKYLRCMYEIKDEDIIANIQNIIAE